MLWQLQLRRLFNWNGKKENKKVNCGTNSIVIILCELFSMQVYFWSIVASLVNQ